MGRTDVLGKTVILDGAGYTIVGVAPPRFDLMTDADEGRPGHQSDCFFDTREFGEFWSRVSPESVR
jgi:hypothetical protein